MRNFSLSNQCGVVEELVCFQYFLNDKNSHYREKQNMILNILVSSHLKFYTSQISVSSLYFNTIKIHQVLVQYKIHISYSMVLHIIRADILRVA